MLGSFMGSSILSEVQEHPQFSGRSSPALVLSSTTGLSALAPAQRAGAQRLCALAGLRHADRPGRCPVPGEDRKSPASGRIDAIDTERTYRLCAACRVLPPAPLRLIIVLSAARTRIASLGVPI